jgi:hypothetical protein
VQRGTAMSKTGNFRDNGLAETPLVFQAFLFDCTYHKSIMRFELCKEQHHSQN